jgi:hypothetical protein
METKKMTLEEMQQAIRDSSADVERYINGDESEMAVIRTSIHVDHRVFGIAFAEAKTCVFQELRVFGKDTTIPNLCQSVMQSISSRYNADPRPLVMLYKMKSCIVCEYTWGDTEGSQSCSILIARSGKDGKPGAVADEDIEALKAYKQRLGSDVVQCFNF